MPHLQSALLAWFAAGARDLPWRRTRDPYRVLVSEVMLQQTQVDRVVPKYLAFLEAFPTLEALAEAPTAEVIRLWAGLGYNRRAVNLQRTARAIVEQHGGQFPRDVESLRALPGIGPYTAGAVACFAFEQEVAFLDTNIRRVLRRLLFGPDSRWADDQRPTAGAPPSDRDLLAHGARLIPPGQGWAWGQAIMELGALICTARAPACRRCPISAHCRAYAELRADDEAAVEAMAVGAAPAPAAARRRVAERREEPYLGSRRFYRGRIIDALRAAPGHAPLALAQIGPLLKPDFADRDMPWLAELARGLARDGLLVLEGETARLPS